MSLKSTQDQVVHTAVQTRDTNLLIAASPTTGLIVDLDLMINPHTGVVVIHVIIHVTGRDIEDHHEILAGLSLVPLAEEGTETQLHITSMWHLMKMYLFVPFAKGTMMSQFVANCAN